MISVVGLGPGDLYRLPRAVRVLLSATNVSVVCRTIHHPAAEELARLRDVSFCDDLYDRSDSYEDIYTAIADRVLEASRDGDVIYAVPGSPYVGEFAVRKIMTAGGDVEIVAGESFVDAVLTEVDYDPLDRGLQILNGHELPDPLVLDKPTIIGHLDRPETVADVTAALDRVLPEDAVVTLLKDLGSDTSAVITQAPAEVDSALAGNRTSIYVDEAPGGLIGAVATMRRLRDECPWDQEQTHGSLVKNLVEEAYELIDAITRLANHESDWVAYSQVEDELGDVLLQVLFHSAIAREARAFDIDDVAETMRRKLVRRHPHVFGDTVVDSAAEVKANWDRIKQSERPDGDRGSALDGIPEGMPAMHRAAKIQNRAAKVGFDWDQAAEVVGKVAEEVEELTRAVGGDGDVEAELGDLLFSVVNLARHLDIDGEIALRSSTTRFEERFRLMEEDGPLAGLSLDELNRRWEEAKNR